MYHVENGRLHGRGSDRVVGIIVFRRGIAVRPNVERPKCLVEVNRLAALIGIASSWISTLLLHIDAQAWYAHVDSHKFQHPILGQYTEHHLLARLIVRIDEW